MKTGEYLFRSLIKKKKKNEAEISFITHRYFSDEKNIAKRKMK